MTTKGIRVLYENRYAVCVFVCVFILLSFVQLYVPRPIVFLERLLPGTGWISIIVASTYVALLFYKMQDITKSAYWRKLSWTIFSVIFFLQLILGLSGVEEFLMTGKLHLPVPAMILCGPLYRGELSFMPILLIVTLLLCGPAWCSHLCYFGVWDHQLSGRKAVVRPLKYLQKIRAVSFVSFITGALIVRFFGNSSLALFFSVGAGIGGILIMLFLSSKKRKMIHCIAYCPINSIAVAVKKFYPIRMGIRNDCSMCFVCASYCQYDALTSDDLRKGRPGNTCTYCGDCLQSCNSRSIEYQLFRLNPRRARNIYLAITVSIHAIFLTLARI